MQTKCRFYTRERRTLRYRAVPSKRGHQKALQICVSFEKLRRPKLTRERQNDSRGVGGGDPSRKYQLQHNYVWRTIRERRQKKRERKRRMESQSVSAAVGELCMTAMIDLWKEHTPKGYWKALNSWHQQTLRHWKGEERWRRRSKRSRRIQSKGKFFSFVIV